MMFVRVALAPQSLLDLGEGFSIPVAKRNHRDLLRALAAHGCLVFAGPHETSTFVKIIRASDQLPPGASQKWQTLVEEFLKRQPKRVSLLEPARDFTFANLRSMKELSDVWSTNAGVAVVDSSIGGQLGIPADEGFVMLEETGLQVTLASSAAECQLMVRFQDLVDKGFLERNAQREDFWDDVLGPLALESHQATIVDRYLFNHVTRRGQPRQDGHVAWLLEHLTQSLRTPGRVTLVGEQPDDMTPSGVVESVERLHRRRGAQKVEVEVAVVAQKSRASDGQLLFPHDRHIRFDIGSAILLPAGFDRLGHPCVRDLDGMKWSYVWTKAALQNLISAEERCLTASGTTRTTLLER